MSEGLKRDAPPSPAKSAIMKVKKVAKTTSETFSTTTKSVLNTVKNATISRNKRSSAYEFNVNQSKGLQPGPPNIIGGTADNFYQPESSINDESGSEYEGDEVDSSESQSADSGSNTSPSRLLSSIQKTASTFNQTVKKGFNESFSPSSSSSPLSNTSLTPTSPTNLVKMRSYVIRQYNDITPLKKRDASSKLARRKNVESMENGEGLSLVAARVGPKHLWSTAGKKLGVEVRFGPGVQGTNVSINLTSFGVAPLNDLESYVLTTMKPQGIHFPVNIDEQKTQTKLEVSITPIYGDIKKISAKINLEQFNELVTDGKQPYLAIKLLGDGTAICSHLVLKGTDIEDENHNLTDISFELDDVRRDMIMLEKKLVPRVKDWRAIAKAGGDKYLEKLIHDYDQRVLDELNTRILTTLLPQQEPLADLLIEFFESKKIPGSAGGAPNKSYKRALHMTTADGVICEFHPDGRSFYINVPIGPATGLIDKQHARVAIPVAYKEEIEKLHTKIDSRSPYWATVYYQSSRDSDYTTITKDFLYIDFFGLGELIISVELSDVPNLQPWINEINGMLEQIALFESKGMDVVMEDIQEEVDFNISEEEDHSSDIDPSGDVLDIDEELDEDSEEEVID